MSDRLLDYKWGSNLPVLDSVTDVFDITGVLELGIGRHSTPLLYSKVKSLISVETDVEWVKTVGSIVKPRDGFKLVHHGVGVHHKTKYPQITNDIKKTSLDFYNNIIKENPELNFLFIDHVSGLRVTALVNLFSDFDIIVYHDAQHPGYYYSLFDSVDSSEYFHFIHEMPLVHSGILVHKKYKDLLKSFDSVLKEKGLSFCKKFDIEYLHILKKKG